MKTTWRTLAVVGVLAVGGLGSSEARAQFVGGGYGYGYGGPGVSINIGAGRGYYPYAGGYYGGYPLVAPAPVVIAPPPVIVARPPYYSGYRGYGGYRYHGGGHHYYRH